YVPGPMIDVLPQARRPARDRERALAARSLAVPGVAAIGGNRRIETVTAHEGEHLARIGSELQLEELLPHLFLGTAEDRNVAAKPARAPNPPRAEPHHFVDVIDTSGPVAKHIARLAPTTPGLEPPGEALMQSGEPLRFAINRRNGPDATGPPQYRINRRFAGS